MPEPEIEIRNGLIELGLSGAELENNVEKLSALRQEMGDAFAKSNVDEVWSGVLIANNPKAILAVESISDMIVETQGILEKALMGEDIHDTVALIKAKIESLIVGGKVKPRTLDRITQSLKTVKKGNV